MVVLTRPDGSRVALNADHVERVDEAPHTLVTMINGNAYVVAEPLDEVVDRVTAYQARVRAERPLRSRSRSARSTTPHLTLAGEPPTPPTGAPAPPAQDS